jgi:hypothetical protein
MNEIAEANRPSGLNQNIAQETDQHYQEWLKQDQERVLAEETSKKNMEFDKVRQLGFVTKQDIDKNIEQYYGKFMEQVNKLVEENTKLREMVYRARAQGMNGGATDSTAVQQADNNTIANRFARPFNSGMRK